jgi:hypothetical protein
VCIPGAWIQTSLAVSVILSSGFVKVIVKEAVLDGGFQEGCESFVDGVFVKFRKEVSNCHCAAKSRDGAFKMCADFRFNDHRVSLVDVDIGRDVVFEIVGTQARSCIEKLRVAASRVMEDDSACGEVDSDDFRDVNGPTKRAFDVVIE